MCKFCDFNNDVISLREDTTCSNELVFGACIIPPTPISVRKNPERPASIQIFDGVYRDIPIAYCPVCGRKL